MVPTKKKNIISAHLKKKDLLGSVWLLVKSKKMWCILKYIIMQSNILFHLITLGKFEQILLTIIKCRSPCKILTF